VSISAFFGCRRNNLKRKEQKRRKEEKEKKGNPILQNRVAHL
jgi:hypothetical protein